LRDKELRTELHAYLGGICRNLESPALIINGVDDHVHILCRLSRTITIAGILRDLKADSSKWLKMKDPSFSWQNEYGAFLISPGHVEGLRKYIAGQEEHHRKETFSGRIPPFIKEIWHSI
jgi:REP element-mobilizing transposase RayT